MLPGKCDCFQQPNVVDRVEREQKSRGKVFTAKMNLYLRQAESREVSLGQVCTQCSRDVSQSTTGIPATE